MDQRVRQFSVIYIASDHAGWELKQAIIPWLQAEQFTVIDCGPTEYDAEDDYPDYILPAVQAMLSEASAAAIVIGGSGQGEAMTANRTAGVRAAVYYGGDRQIPALSREHNDANVLSLGARFLGTDEAKWAVWEWLHTAALTDEKYARRNEKIDFV